MGEYPEKVESVRGQKNRQDQYRKMVESVWYHKMVASGRVPGKSRICVSTEYLSERVPKKGRISVSTDKLFNPGEYRERVEFMRVP